MRIIGWIDTVGSALLAQLMFVLLSIPLITCAPAAIALQRQLAAIAAGRPAGVRPFLRDFAGAWRQAWPTGPILLVAAIGLAVAVPFWFGSGGWYGLIAGGVLCCLGGLALALWLALLTVARDDTVSPLRQLATAAGRLMVVRAGRLLLALVLVITWLALAAVVPALLLVGSGLLPAMVVEAVVRSREERRGVAGQASRS